MTPSRYARSLRGKKGWSSPTETRFLGIAFKSVHALGIEVFREKKEEKDTQGRHIGGRARRPKTPLLSNRFSLFIPSVFLRFLVRITTHRLADSISTRITFSLGVDFPKPYFVCTITLLSLPRYFSSFLLSFFPSAYTLKLLMT
jgi:hypothetical protein